MCTKLSHPIISSGRNYSYSVHPSHPSISSRRNYSYYTKPSHPNTNSGRNYSYSVQPKDLKSAMGDSDDLTIRTLQLEGNDQGALAIVRCVYAGMGFYSIHSLYSNDGVRAAATVVSRWFVKEKFVAEAVHLKLLSFFYSLFRGVLHSMSIMSFIRR
jgi:hypothetical protein